MEKKNWDTGSDWERTLDKEQEKGNKTRVVGAFRHRDESRSGEPT